MFKSLCASHRMPIAKLRGDVNGEVAPSGQWARLTKSAEHLLNDGCNIPGIVDPSVIGTLLVNAFHVGFSIDCMKVVSERRHPLSSR